MKLVVDMNLSPSWCGVLDSHGLEARHWIEVGSPQASDRDIMNWAGANACVVLTQDLDFGAILAVSGWRGPSVVQLRGGDLRAARIGDRVATVIQSLEAELRIGALVTISSATERVKLLPLRLPRVPDNA